MRLAVSVLSGEVPNGKPSREEILEAVADVFVERGFHGATVRELGKAAGISQGTLYYHIGSKTQALIDIHNSFVEGMIGSLSSVAESNLAPTQKLRQMIEVMLETVALNRTKLALFLRERRSLPPDAQQNIRRQSDRIDGFLRSILEEGNSAGCWNKEISLQSARLAIFGMVSWAVEWLNTEGPKSPQAFAEEFTEVVLLGLTPR